MTSSESIEIVEAFTSWSDFDGDEGIDGLTLYIRPTDSDGIPLPADATINVEVWRKRRATGLAEGDRVGIWDFSVMTEAEKSTRWRRSMEMYELPVALPIEAMSVTPGSAVLVSATYHTSDGKHLADQIEMRLPLGQMALTGQQP